MSGGGEKIQSAYRQSISIYDEILVGRTWWSKLYLKIFWGGVNDLYVAEKLLRMIPDSFSGRLLDVPVGTAHFTADKYKKLKSAEIIALDYSQDMLDKAKERFKTMEIENVELLQGDVGNLPIEDESIDMLLSMNGFHAFPDKEAAYSECNRVLRRGGVFIGCFVIRGEVTMGDFLVKNVLTKKGWFTPPFETRESLRNRLERDYNIVEYYVDGAVVSFYCIKK